MADILLTTFNAKYIHAAFGLRYLQANLGALRARSQLVEFDLQQRAVDIVEALLVHHPRIIGIGVYIWNAQLSLEVVQLLKRLAPGVTIVLGGPEVSYEWESQPIVQLADYVITGEADLQFAALCDALLNGTKPAAKVQVAPVPELGHVQQPYALYEDRDLQHRVVYVEASRGCPFTCEFCLSSLEIPVRQFPLPEFLASLEQLLRRGLRQFKFVDRTFNLNLAASQTILDFFLERNCPGLFLHFEMIPDRLPEGLRARISRFPAGTLQFEVGIQTFNVEVAERIRRRQNYAKLADNFRFLRDETGVHIHADLIIGLPGETVESFGAGFDQLIALRPQEIQVGILKRLRGTPIVRHDVEWAMVYSPQAPYEILQNRLISFEQMQRLRRFARHWDLVANSGNFVESTPLLWHRGNSPFAAFMGWSEFLYERLGRNHGIALVVLTELFFRYLTEECGVDVRRAAEILWRDYQRGGRSDRPVFLRPHLPAGFGGVSVAHSGSTPKRQLRHQTSVPMDPAPAGSPSAVDSSWQLGKST